MIRFFTIAIFVFLVVFQSGCGSGSKRTGYQVSGTVIYDGQPLPAGQIVITPDGSKGNSGSQAIGKITDGKYTTRGSRAPLAASGPVLATVTGWSDSSGSKVLVEKTLVWNLPEENTVRDIELEKQIRAPVGPDF